MNKNKDLLLIYKKYLKELNCILISILDLQKITNSLDYLVKNAFNIKNCS